MKPISAEEINKIGNCLAQYPYKDVFPTIELLREVMRRPEYPMEVIGPQPPTEPEGTT